MGADVFNGAQKRRPEAEEFPCEYEQGFAWVRPNELQPTRVVVAVAGGRVGDSRSRLPHCAIPLPRGVVVGRGITGENVIRIRVPIGQHELTIALIEVKAAVGGNDDEAAGERLMPDAPGETISAAQEAAIAAA